MSEECDFFSEYEEHFDYNEVIIKLSEHKSILYFVERNCLNILFCLFVFLLFPLLFLLYFYQVLNFPNVY